MAGILVLSDALIDYCSDFIPYSSAKSVTGKTQLPRADKGRISWYLVPGCLEEVQQQASAFSRQQTNLALGQKLVRIQETAVIGL